MVVKTGSDSHSELGIKRVLQSEETKLTAKRRKQAEREAKLREKLGYDQDENFAFIIGYISGGAPYGMTWEEWVDIKDAETLMSSLTKMMTKMRRNQKSHWRRVWEQSPAANRVNWD